MTQLIIPSLFFFVFYDGQLYAEGIKRGSISLRKERKKPLESIPVTIFQIYLHYKAKLIRQEVVIESILCCYYCCYQASLQYHLHVYGSIERNKWLYYTPTFIIDECSGVFFKWQMKIDCSKRKQRFFFFFFFFVFDQYIIDMNLTC